MQWTFAAVPTRVNNMKPFLTFLLCFVRVGRRSASPCGGCLGAGLLLLRFGGSRFTAASAIQSEYSELSESLVVESLEPAMSSE